MTEKWTCTLCRADGLAFVIVMKGCSTSHVNDHPGHNMVLVQDNDQVHKAIVGQEAVSWCTMHDLVSELTRFERIEHACMG